MSSSTIEIARRLAELGQKEQAQQAYSLILQQEAGRQPELEMEAASYIFFSEGDYQIAYSTFVSLYNRGFYRNELMNLMTQAFYLPNVDQQRKQYEQNCERLGRYRFLFRKDFMPFDALPILFFPFNDDGFIPYYKAENRFGDYVNFNHPVIDRYFFKDLENPILAEDVYSQYQLEYLNDTVRKSEWVGRENHIYLHYSDWAIFCAHLQCLDFTGLLRDSKQVFLMEDEIAQYPIDFKERFGIDYSKYTPRPVGIREINRLIWQVQLSMHNGGNFFAEIMDDHPYLLTFPSIMFEKISKYIAEAKSDLKKTSGKVSEVVRALRELGNPTDKDVLVASFMAIPENKQALNRSSRIAPAVFFQPHFSNIRYKLAIERNKTQTFLLSDQAEAIQQAPLFSQFKYIKNFTPMRCPTVSYAATMRYSVDPRRNPERRVVPDRVMECALNRSFMIDWQNRLFQDSILVRFEDGKLNPKATFTALAAFLDIPYTESMTYCSMFGKRDPESMQGDARGFDPVAVYSTYDEYANDDERAFLEYFLRDVYENYGYDFRYYKGEPVDEAWVKARIAGFTCLDHYIEKSWEKFLDTDPKKTWTAQESEQKIKKVIDSYHQNRWDVAKLLMRGLNFVNHRRQPLHMMKPLQLDPDLLEQPLYH